MSTFGRLLLSGAGPVLYSEPVMFNATGGPCSIAFSLSLYLSLSLSPQSPMLLRVVSQYYVYFWNIARIVDEHPLYF